MSKIEEIKKKYLSDFYAGNYLVTKGELEYLLRIAEVAEEFTKSLKGKSGAIMSPKSFIILNTLLKALEGSGE